jgi:hypothetical protein
VHGAPRARFAHGDGDDAERQTLDDIHEPSSPVDVDRPRQLDGSAAGLHYRYQRAIADQWAIAPPTGMRDTAEPEVNRD